MHALIEHVHAEQQLQVVAFVLPEGVVRTRSLRVLRIDLIAVRLRVHRVEPLVHMGQHFLHVIHTCAEHDIASVPVRHVPGKHGVQALRLFKGAAQSLQVALAPFPIALVALRRHPFLIPGQTLLILIDCGHIFRRRQNAPDDGFPQGHFGGDAIVEKFLGHVALVVEVADVSGGQPQQL